MRQGPPRLPLVGGEPEGPQRPEAVAEPRLHEVQHPFHRLVRRELHRPAVVDGIGRGLAVVVVIVPLPALGLVAVHQKARLAPHLAVEILHPQRLAALGPVFEFLQRRDEARVLQLPHLQRHLVQQLDQPPFPGPGADDLLRPALFGPAQKLSGDRPGIAGIVELGITHVPAGLAQTCRELAHGGEDQRDLLGVMLHVAGLVRDLRHHHDVLGLVGLLQRRQLLRQLVAQHEHQPAHHGTALPCQSKNPPLSAGVSRSITDSRLAAASSAVTVG